MWKELKNHSPRFNGPFLGIELRLPTLDCAQSTSWCRGGGSVDCDRDDDDQRAKEMGDLLLHPSTTPTALLPNDYASWKKCLEIAHPDDSGPL